MLPQCAFLVHTASKKRVLQEVEISVPVWLGTGNDKCTLSFIDGLHLRKRSWCFQIGVSKLHFVTFEKDLDTF